MAGVQITKFVSRVGLLSIVLLALGCSKDCTYLKGVAGEAQCKAAPASITKTRTIPKPASCAGVANSRTLQINCSAANATGCDLTSNGAGFFAILLPNDGSGQYTEPTLGQFQNCGQVWSALLDGSTFTNITGVYLGDPANGDSVQCTAASCTVTTTACFSTWDGANGVPTSVAASIAPATSLVGCVFIDTGALGFPPTTGVPATSAEEAIFAPATVASPISFSGAIWTDY